MRNVALSTFLKLLHHNTNGKATDLARYSTPSGYDYYRTLRRQSTAYVVNNLSFEDACSPIHKLNSPHEEANNLAGMKALRAWWKKNGGTPFAAPKSYLDTPQKLMRIKLEPEFGFERDGTRCVVTLWNTKTPKLTKASAGLGVYLLEKRLKKKQCSDCEFQILDLRTGKLYTNDAIPNHAEMLLNAELVTIDSLMESLGAA